MPPQSVLMNDVSDHLLGGTRANFVDATISGMAAVHRDGHIWSNSLTDGMANFDDQLNGEDDAT